MIRVAYENNSDVGVWARLTNSYALCPVGASENFYSAFQAELGDAIPVRRGARGVGTILGAPTLGAHRCTLPHDVMQSV